MTNPISFTSTTPRFNLPNLFVAQAQKEFTINEALARLDSLIHPVVEGEANDPPASPNEGDCWIIGTQPTGEWATNSGGIACRQSANWIYLQPKLGMSVTEIASGSVVHFDGSWQRIAAIPTPMAGATEDTEARETIVALISALVTAGILPEN